MIKYSTNVEGTKIASFIYKKNKARKNKEDRAVLHDDYLDILD